MKSFAVIVSGGSTNNLLQVLTLLMAAVHADIKVRVLFRDEAVFRLTPEKINACELSDAYGPDGAAVRARLQRLDLADAQRLCRDIKASGDVKLYACSSSLAVAGLTRERLIPEVDDVRGLPTFLLEDVATADRVFTF